MLKNAVLALNSVFCKLPNKSETFLNQFKHVFCMAEEESKEETVTQTVGKVVTWYEKIMGYIASRVSSFVAFLFFLFTMGAFFGMVAVQHAPQFAFYIVMAPAVLGLIAYYNRSFATVMFILLLIFVFI